MNHYDKHGTEIRAGDLLYNINDEEKIIQVISDGVNLFLGDLDSPLERYGTEYFWEITT